MAVVGYEKEVGGGLGGEEVTAEGGGVHRSAMMNWKRELLVEEGEGRQLRDKEKDICNILYVIKCIIHHTMIHATCHKLI